MGVNSKIEWTENTFNPWIGCAKISPACDHCYAADLSARTFAAASVPFMFKQWGEWCPIGGETGMNYKGPLLNPDRVHWIFPDGSHEPVGCGRVGVLTNRVGKKAAGRLLDGVEHNGRIATS